METKKRYTVQILGDEYTLVSDEAEAHIKETAITVDKLMRQLAENLQNVDHKKIAILTALRLASDLLLTQDSLQAIEEKKSALIDRINQELLTPLS